MKLGRRDFLKLAGLSGLAAAVPVGVYRALADAPTYEGPYWLQIHAAGAWDPLFFCDPKSSAELNRVSSMVGTAGSTRFADVPIDLAALALDATYATEYGRELLSNATFFDRHASRFVVLNGINTTTNNHDTGTRVVWSGKTGEGYPSIAALTAAARGPDVSMAYVSAGGYDSTGNLVPLTRVANAGVLGKLAYPNVVDPANEMSESYHAASTYERIVRAQRERLAASRDRATLPSHRRGMSSLLMARENDTGLERLVLPEMLYTIPGYQLGDLQNLKQQTQLTLAAFQAGLAVAGNLVIGGFDTHADHDRAQVRQIAKILSGVDFVIQEATRLGIVDRLYLLVGSDFGRGPRYNGTGTNAGKDHWPITSMLVSGPGITGGRVIGATNDEQRPLALDPSSLEPSAEGVILSPGHVHQALRRLAGVDTSDVAASYPLLEDPLPLFA